MRLRSLSPGTNNSERRLAKSAGAKADVLILDLEDSVAPSQKQVARERVRAYMANAAGRGATQLWVRINPVDLPEAMTDLAAVMSARPDGIIQPKTRSPDDIIRLSYYLDAFEAQHHL